VGLVVGRKAVAGVLGVSTDTLDRLMRELPKESRPPVLRLRRAGRRRRTWVAGFAALCQWVGGLSGGFTSRK
jgi:hypothetical protein